MTASNLKFEIEMMVGGEGDDVGGDFEQCAQLPKSLLYSCSWKTDTKNFSDPPSDFVINNLLTLSPSFVSHFGKQTKLLHDFEVSGTTGLLASEH